MEHKHQGISAIRTAVNLVCRKQGFVEKCGERDLKPAIANALEHLGFDVDTGDKRKFLRAGNRLDLTWPAQVQFARQQPFLTTLGRQFLAAVQG
jgi:hypothetical protein